MSNYATLKAAIQSAVYTNNNNEITGAGLQSVLLQIVNTIGDGYVFKGVATAGTSPGTPDENVFYIAPAGTYANFGSSYTVPVGSIGVFAWDGAWSFDYASVSNISGFFNVSAAYPTDGNLGGNRYTLIGALSKVPSDMRSAGLRVSFVNADGNPEAWMFYDESLGYSAVNSWVQVDKLAPTGIDELAVSGINANVATEYTSVILTLNGYISTSGAFTSHSSYSASDFIAVPEKPSAMRGTMRMVRVESRCVSNGSVSTIAFYDSSKRFIRSNSTESTVGGYNVIHKAATYIVPTDAAYFRATDSQGNTYFKVTFDVTISGVTADLYSLIQQTNGQIDDINTESAAYKGLKTSYSSVFDSSILTIPDTYISTNGSEVSNSSYVSSPLTPLPTKPARVYGDIRLARLTSRVSLNASLAPIAWYDSDGTFISVQRTPSLIVGENNPAIFSALYFIPQNAAYFRVSDRKVSPYVFELIVDVAANGLIGKVMEHDLSLGAMAGISSPSVWMPKHIYMLRGIQSQIFMAGIACAQNPETLHMNITYGNGMTSSNAKGYNRDRVFEWTPSASDVNQVYRFGYTHDFFGSVDAANATTLHNVAAKTSPLSNKNILCIGDSFTDQNWWVSELNHLLTGHTDSLTDPNNTHGNDGLTNLTFIGTQDTDKTPNEGYSGKTYQWFCESESPFYYNGDVNFTSYCNANGFSGIDIAIILLGTNGGNGEQYVKKIWDKLLEHNPNVKVLILGRCFAVPYGTGTAGMRYNQTWIKQSQGVQPQNSIFEGYTEEAGYSGNFLYVEYNALLDNANNMPWSNVDANDRRTDVKVRQATDNVHPSKYGYWQIADAVRGAFHYWCI